MNLRNKLDGFRQLWWFDNRWQLIVGRLVFPRQPVSIYRVGDLAMVVDHSAGDANGVREVFTTPMYRDLLVGFDLGRSPTVLDLGAHIGSFPLLLASLGHEPHRTVCVEMNPHTATRLRYNLATNLTGDVDVIAAAVCGDGVDRVVTLGSGGTGDSIEHGAIAGADATDHLVSGMTVDRVVRDTFGSDPIDVCKIDVEGAEYDIFSQDGHGSLRQCGHVIIEIHDRSGRDPAAVVDAIVGLGFEPTGDAHGDVYAFRNTADAGSAAGSGAGARADDGSGRAAP